MCPFFQPFFHAKPYVNDESYLLGIEKPYLERVLQKWNSDADFNQTRSVVGASDFQSYTVWGSRASVSHEFW